MLNSGGPTARHGVWMSLASVIGRRNFVGLGLAVGVGVLACGQGCKGSSNEAVVGAYLSLSGSDSTFGTDTRDGVDLALDEVNQKGGVKFPIAIEEPEAALTRDTRWVEPQPSGEEARGEAVRL